MFGDTPEPDHREIFYDEKIEIKIHRPAGVAWSGVDLSLSLEIIEMENCEIIGRLSPLNT